MTTKLSGLIVVFGLAGLAGCATAPVSRGAVLTTAPATRAIVAGPIDVRAYSGFRGGEIYFVKTSRGADADCAATPDRAAAISIPADQVISLDVPSGETACLRTRVSSGYELLWRARAGQASGTVLAHAPRHAGT
jgi:hypothetical protein